MYKEREKAKNQISALKTLSFYFVLLLLSKAKNTRKNPFRIKITERTDLFLARFSLRSAPFVNVKSLNSFVVIFNLGKNMNFHSRVLRVKSIKRIYFSDFFLFRVLFCCCCCYCLVKKLPFLISARFWFSSSCRII